MIKRLIIFVVFLLVILASQFTQSIPAAGVTSICDTVDVNPNGSSELSLLMRKMYDHIAAARNDVLAKKIRSSFPQEFLTIYSAKPTDSLTKNSSFDPLADLYIHSLNIFTGSTTANLIQNYNAVLTACINCHSQHCPGPVAKMKKLLIDVPE
jgi:hypothetical protein